MSFGIIQQKLKHSTWTLDWKKYVPSLIYCGIVVIDVMVLCYGMVMHGKYLLLCVIVVAQQRARQPSPLFSGLSITTQGEAPTLNMKHLRNHFVRG